MNTKSDYSIQYKLQLSKHPLDPSKVLVRPVIIPQHADTAEAAAKHVIFLLDRSGSMKPSEYAGDCIGMVKTSVQAFMKNALEADDRLSVVLYDGNATVLINQVRKEDLDKPMVAGCKIRYKTKNETNYWGRSDKFVGAENSFVFYGDNKLYYIDANRRATEIKCDQFKTKYRSVFHTEITALTDSQPLSLEQLQALGLNEYVPTPITACANIDCKGGTEMQLALGKVGTDELPIDDASNTHIILLTDGANGTKLNPTDEVKALIQRMPDEVCPRIYPVGIGLYYKDDFLSSFGTLTGVEQKFHISKAQDIQGQFEIIQRSLKPSTLNKVDLQITTEDGTSITNPLGKIPLNEASGFTIVLDMFDKETSLMLSSSLDGKVSSIPVSPEMITLDKEVVAYYAYQKIMEITADGKNKDKKLAESVIEKIKAEVLPLLGSESLTDTDYVKVIRHFIIQTILFYQMDSHNEDAKRAVDSSVTQVSRAGICTAVGLKYLQAGESVDFKLDERSITIQGKSYYVLGQDVDYVKNNGLLVSLDARLSTREAILINPKSEKIKDLCSAYQGNNESLEDNLSEIASLVQEVFPGSETHLVQSENTYRINSDQKVLTIDLDDFIQQGQGVCRHYASLTAVLVSKLVRDRLPKGSVHQYRGLSVDGELAHSWVVYRTGSKDYLIDATNPHQMVYNLSDKAACFKARSDYAKRGLAGVLDSALSHLGHLSQQQAIAQNVLDAVSADAMEDFITEGLTCPISCDIMAKPVRIQGQSEQHVFEEESIQAWLAQRKTNPLTNEACETVLIPAVDVRDKILFKCLGSKLPAEGQLVSMQTEETESLRAKAERIRLVAAKGQLMVEEEVKKAAVPAAQQTTTTTTAPLASKPVEKEREAAHAQTSSVPKTVSSPVMSPVKRKTSAGMRMSTDLGKEKEHPKSTPSTPKKRASDALSEAVLQQVQFMQEYVETRSKEEGICAYFRDCVRLNGKAKIAAANKAIKALQGKECYFTKLDIDALTEKGSVLHGLYVQCNPINLNPSMEEKALTDPKIADLLNYVQNRRKETGIMGFFRNLNRFDEKVKTDAAEKLIDLYCGNDSVVFNALDIEALTEEDSQLGAIVRNIYHAGEFLPEVIYQMCKDQEEESSFTDDVGLVSLSD